MNTDDQISKCKNCGAVLYEPKNEVRTPVFDLTERIAPAMPSRHVATLGAYHSFDSSKPVRHVATRVNAHAAGVIFR